FEQVFFCDAVLSSLVSAGVATFGLQLIRRYARLAQQNTHYQTISEQQARLREVFDIIHHTQDRDLVCNNVLKAALELSEAESVSMIPYCAETRRFGAPIASLPTMAEPMQLLPSLTQRLRAQDTPSVYTETIERQGI